MTQLTPDDVQQALDALGLEIQVQQFETSTATAQEAADEHRHRAGHDCEEPVFCGGG